MPLDLPSSVYYLSEKPSDMQPQSKIKVNIITSTDCFIDHVYDGTTIKSYVQKFCISNNIDFPSVLVYYNHHKNKMTNDCITLKEHDIMSIFASGYTPDFKVYAILSSSHFKLPLPIIPMPEFASILHLFGISRANSLSSATLCKWGYLDRRRLYRLHILIL